MKRHTLIINISGICFLLFFSGCFCVYTWIPLNISKKEWRGDYGHVDTSKNLIECEHILVYGRFLYNQRKPLDVSYTIGGQEDTIRLVNFELFTNKHDTLKCVDNESGNLTFTGEKLFTYKGIRHMRYLNLSMKYTLLKQGKIDTITKLYNLKRKLFFEFMFLRND